MKTHLKVISKSTVSIQNLSKKISMSHFFQNQVFTLMPIFLVMISLGSPNPVHGGVRIETPVVIPKDVIPGKDSTQTGNGQPAPQKIKADANESGVPQPQPPTETADQKTEISSADGAPVSDEANSSPVPLEPEFAFASANSPFTSPNSSELLLNSSSNVVSPQQREKEEMYTRMRIAVERIASEYGNPTFGQFFTNDKIRAQVIRNRLQLLQNYETLLSEIATLEKKKSMVAQAVDAASRQRMEQLKLEIRVLEDRKKLVANEVKNEVARQKRELGAEISALEKRKKELERETEQSVLQQKVMIQAETEALNREKNTLEIDVSSQKNELKTLKEQSSLLRERIIKAQKALSLVESGE